MTKQTKITIATILFLIASIADIWAVVRGNEMVETYAKPLLMTFLVIVYLVSVKKPNVWFVLGLFFSFLGDVFLLFNGANFFMFGLGAFLLAHVIYIKITVGFLENDLTMKMITSALPFVLFFAGIFYLIYNGLGEMMFPVIVYGITISTFGAVTLLNYRTEKSTENTWLLLGAIIFIISDSMIAVNKFYASEEIFGVVIMVTYIVAQYLICKAMIAKSE